MTTETSRASIIKSWTEEIGSKKPKGYSLVGFPIRPATMENKT